MKELMQIFFFFFFFWGGGGGGQENFVCEQKEVQNDTTGIHYTLFFLLQTFNFVWGGGGKTGVWAGRPGGGGGSLVCINT